MSVIVAKRSVSTVEYVRQAQRIVDILQERLTKYQKKINTGVRYRHLAKSTFYPIWNAPLFDAQTVYRQVQLANLTKVTDKESFNKRLTHLDQASQYLKLLESDITTLYTSCSSVIKDQFLIVLTQAIDKEVALIKGVKASDKLHFQDIVSD